MEAGGWGGRCKGLGGQRSTGANWEFRAAAFHGQHCNCLSLAEWLLGKILLPAAVESKTSSYWRWKVSVFQFGAIDEP